MSDSGDLYSTNMYNNVVSSSKYTFLKKIASKARSSSTDTNTTTNKETAPGIWTIVNSASNYLPGIKDSADTATVSYLAGISDASSPNSTLYMPCICFSA